MINTRSKRLILDFYKKCLKTINKLDFNHRGIWKSYLKLKMKENNLIKDEKTIRSKINQAEEEINWVISILNRKSNNIQK